MTPLMADCYVALDILHCTPHEYYQRTTAYERTLIRLVLAYRQAQEQTRQGIRQDRHSSHDGHL